MTWGEAMQVACERAKVTNRHYYVRGYIRGINHGWGYAVFVVPRRKL